MYYYYDTIYSEKDKQQLITDRQVDVSICNLCSLSLDGAHTPQGERARTTYRSI